MSTLADALLRKDRSLARFRSIVITASVLILIILGVGLYIVYQDAARLRRQINYDFNQQQLILARQAAMQIEAALRDVRAELERFSRYQPRLTSRADTLDAVNVLVEYARDHGVREIGVIRPDGQVTTYYSLGRIERPADSVVRRALQTDRPVMITEHTAPRDGLISRTLTGLLCVPEPHSRSGAVLYARLDLTKLVGTVAAEVRSGRTGYAWVLDGAGRFLFHIRDEFIARDAVGVRREFAPGNDFADVRKIMHDHMLQGQQGTGKYRAQSATGADNLIDKLVAYTPVESDLLPADNIWSVAVSAPVNEVAETVQDATVRHIVAEAAMITSMFLLGIFAIVYERRISRALSKRVIEQQNYLSSILQNTVDGIIIIDEQDRVLVWNRGAELIFGYSEEEMLGKTFRPVVPPDVDAEEELRKINERIHRDGFLRNYRAQRIRKDGKRITVDISRTLISSREGKEIGSVAIIKDVTEEVAMEQRMYNTEKLASIGTLAAGVAHEINNPLAVILGFTDLLKEKFEKGTPELEDLNMIEQNAEAAKKTVENLLGFARVREGEYGTFDIVQSLRTVVNIVESTLLKNHIRLETDIPDDLPPIRGDAREFQQVVFNLVNNAIAAMKDQEQGVIRISSWQESGRTCVRVTDTGPGIPDRIKGRIFDPFFTTKKVGEGTGLGLSLCYGIIKKYGGSIDFFSHSAEDNPDDPTGTSFTVAVPRAEAASDEGKET